MAIVTAGVAGIDFDSLIVADVLLGTVTSATGTRLTLRDGAWQDDFTGQFTYSNGEISGGTMTGWKQSFSGQTMFDLTDASVPVTQFVTWAATNNNEAAKATILAGSDSILGSDAVDRLHGYAGNDTISAGGSDDFIRGEDGNDLIHGGAGFDDTLGNKGDDTIYGGLGPDWVVGGQDNDLLHGEDGADIVYGNLGNDVAYGGAGGDWVRGGQGDDSISGDAGDDWMSGDRGSDTISGGLGADIFHAIVDTGIDRVIDFSRAEGDRVQIESGSWTTAQVGADTMITLSGGGQMILVGVQLSSLTGDWIFTG